MLNEKKLPSKMWNMFKMLTKRKAGNVKLIRNATPQKVILTGNITKIYAKCNCSGIPYVKTSTFRPKSVVTFEVVRFTE